MSAILFYSQSSSRPDPAWKVHVLHKYAPSDDYLEAGRARISSTAARVLDEAIAIAFAVLEVRCECALCEALWYVFEWVAERERERLCVCVCVCVVFVFVFVFVFVCVCMAALLAPCRASSRRHGCARSTCGAGRLSTVRHIHSFVSLGLGSLQQRLICGEAEPYT
jgi:hypothetical protein